MSIELYFFQPLATNSGRVYLTLLEKGVEFVERELKPLAFEHLDQPYLSINPRGQVPTLVHEGQALTEGRIINEYIDEAFPGPALRPAAPRERWQMRRWCRYVELELGRSIMMINWNRIVPLLWGSRSAEEVQQIIDRVPDPDRRRAWRTAYLQQTPPALIEESLRRVAAGVQRIEASLRNTPWLAGSTHSLADIDLYNFCILMARWVPDVVSDVINDARTPAITAWVHRMETRPAVQAMAARTRLPA